MDGRIRIGLAGLIVVIGGIAPRVTVLQLLAQEVGPVDREAIAHSRGGVGEVPDHGDRLAAHRSIRCAIHPFACP